MSREEARKQWKARVDEFLASDETAAAWCREHDLNVNPFRRWVRKFAHQTVSEHTSSPVGWLPVRVNESRLVGTSECALMVHVGSVSIEVKSRFHPLCNNGQLRNTEYYNNKSDTLLSLSSLIDSIYPILGEPLIRTNLR